MPEPESEVLQQLEAAVTARARPELVLEQLEAARKFFRQRFRRPSSGSSLLSLLLPSLPDVET